MCLFHRLFYWYIDYISSYFDHLHTTFQLLSICTNRIWAHYLGFFLHFLISIFLAWHCVMWLWFTSSHHNFNLFTLKYYFFRFNYYERMFVHIMSCCYPRFLWLTLGLSYNDILIKINLVFKIPIISNHFQNQISTILKLFFK